ncbi:MAG: OmpA family protein [Sphingomonadaceae bacterium]
MKAFRLANVLAGLIAVIAIAFATNAANGPRFIAGLEAEAKAARDEAGASGVRLSFRTAEGWLTRHPILSGGEAVSDEARTQAAQAISRVPGIGGVTWQGAGGTTRGEQVATFHCKDDVEAILEARSIRFSEASAKVDPASQTVLDEVATALQPCVGSIIAITGHTDGNGDPDANLALSLARAEAVRWALIGRGIPADGLRAEGKGSEKPVEGLDPLDSANRRIEFSVIETVPIKPTPIDTPGPG